MIDCITRPDAPECPDLDYLCLSSLACTPSSLCLQPYGEPHHANCIVSPPPSLRIAHALAKMKFAFAAVLFTGLAAAAPRASCAALTSVD